MRGSLDPASYAYAARMALRAVSTLQTGMKKILLLLMGSEGKDVSCRRRRCLRVGDWGRVYIMEVGIRSITRHDTTQHTTQLRERKDFQQLKASEAWGAAKKMPGQQLVGRCSRRRILHGMEPLHLTPHHTLNENPFSAVAGVVVGLAQAAGGLRPPCQRHQGGIVGGLHRRVLPSDGADLERSV